MISSETVQIVVNDSKGRGAISIRHLLCGMAADMEFWGGESYITKRKGDPFVHVITVPSAQRWVRNLQEEGWQILARLSEPLERYDEGGVSGDAIGKVLLEFKERIEFCERQKNGAIDNEERRYYAGCVNAMEMASLILNRIAFPEHQDTPIP